MKEERNSKAQAEAEAGAGAEKTHIAWSVHLLRRSGWGKGLAAGAVVFACLYAGYRAVDSAFVVGLYGAIMLAALGEFFFPVSYKITDAGVYATSWYGTKLMPWTKVKRVLTDGDGVKLSAFGGDSALERFRGLYVYFEGNGDEVLGLVRRLARGRA